MKKMMEIKWILAELNELVIMSLMKLTYIY